VEEHAAVWIVVHLRARLSNSSTLLFGMCRCVNHVVPVLSQDRTWYQIVLPMLLAMFTIVCISFLWTQYSNPGIRKLAGVKQLLRNAADEMTLVLTDVEGTQALSQWNPGVTLHDAKQHI